MAWQNSRYPRRKRASLIKLNDQNILFENFLKPQGQIKDILKGNLEFSSQEHFGFMASSLHIWILISPREVE